jgi:hypothetical protein
MIIKRVGVVSLAKVMGVLYGGIGLLLGLLFSLFSLAGGSAMLASGSEDAGLGGGMMMGMGLAAVVVFPIMYGILGFIGGLISGALFNLASRFAGGLEIETD